MIEIKKVIIWGHTLHDHTHSYIHKGYYDGFKYLGYETYWFDDTLENLINNDKNDFFSNCLFLAHGLKIKYLPINKNSIYILHNASLKDNTNHEKIPTEYYKNQSSDVGIPENNIIVLQVYTTDCISRDIPVEGFPFHYTNKNTIYMPWATDLLPEQIDENIKNIEKINDYTKNKNVLNFVGMMTDKWEIVKQECKKRNIVFNHYGATFNINSDRNKSSEENMKLIQESIIAPAIQTDWQVEKSYIPCRIFKNISYGKMGITNNENVNTLFGNKLIYSNNISKLFDMAISFDNNIEIIKDLMIEVRNKHTYVNRCEFILNYILKNNEY